MQIIHLNLERGWRGGERQVELLMRELSNLGVRQTLMCRQGSPFLERLHGLPDACLLCAESRMGALRRLPAPDRQTLLHAHTAGTLPLAVLKAGGRAGTLATRRLDLKPGLFFLKRMDRVVAISKRVLDVLGRLPLHPEKLSYIPSAVDLDRKVDPEAGPTLRKQLGLSSETFLGLTVAALVDQKDPLTLVRALPHLDSGYHHVWIGGGPLLEEAQSLAAELGVHQKISFPGFDPHPDRWFAAADIFVLPSRHEGLGSAYLDAFHFGIPIVGSNIPASSELLQDRISALLFPPRDSHLLAHAITELRAASPLRERLRVEGKQRVARYDIRRTAGEYLQLYGEILKKKEPSLPR